MRRKSRTLGVHYIDISSNITSLEISNPEIAKEYSNDNCFSIEILSYDGWRDSQILLN